MSELIHYMQENYLYNNTASVFKLSNVTKLVADRMTDLGVAADDKSINQTRLTQQLM